MLVKQEGWWLGRRRGCIDLFFSSYQAIPVHFLFWQLCCWCINIFGRGEEPEFGDACVVCAEVIVVEVVVVHIHYLVVGGCWYLGVVWLPLYWRYVSLWLTSCDWSFSIIFFIGRQLDSIPQRLLLLLLLLLQMLLAVYLHKLFVARSRNDCALVVSPHDATGRRLWHVSVVLAVWALRWHLLLLLLLLLYFFKFVDTPNIKLSLQVLPARFVTIHLVLLSLVYGKMVLIRGISSSSHMVVYVFEALEDLLNEGVAHDVELQVDCSEFDPVAREWVAAWVEVVQNELSSFKAQVVLSDI